MAKRTKKVGIVGKYGTRYGSSLRKVVKKIETTAHATYVCPFCGRVSSPFYIFRKALREPLLAFGSAPERDATEPSLEALGSLTLPPLSPPNRPLADSESSERTRTNQLIRCN